MAVVAPVLFFARETVTTVVPRASRVLAFQPHMGDFIIEGTLSLGELIQKAPQLEPEKLDRIAARPLGARLTVDPWSSRLDLLRAAAVPLTSAREKVPLAVTPLMPHIRYAEASADVASTKPE